MALYTADAVHVPPAQAGRGEIRGEDALRAHVQVFLQSVVHGTRTGELVALGDDRFRVPIEWDDGRRIWVSQLEIEMSGDQASRIVFLSTEAKN